MNKYASSVVKQAQSWLGYNESNGTHKKIIDVYNSHRPLARGYAVKYTDEWCATFVSAVSIKLGYTDIIPTECSCAQMISLFMKLGAWDESDARIPRAGDVIFYDWDDSGSGDNKGRADHVGIVEKVSDGKITVIEGNYSRAVKRRTLAVNARYIRGYGVPKYDAEQTVKEEVQAKEDVTTKTCKVGDIVTFKGGKHYRSANAVVGYTRKPGKAKVTSIYKLGQSKHPYHLVRVAGGGSNVYGWVNASDIAEIEEVYEPKVGDKVKLDANAKVYGKTYKFSPWVYRCTLFVRSVSGSRVVVSTTKTGAVTGAVDKKYISKA